VVIDLYVHKIVGWAIAANMPTELVASGLQMALQQRKYANHAEATRDIVNYIVAFYNCVRLRSTLGYVSLVQYGLQAAQQPIWVYEIT